MTYKSFHTEVADQPEITPVSRLQTEAQLVAKVCAWIDLHLAEDIGWPELVSMSGLSVARLKEVFDRHLKTTPMTYIRQRRTESR